MPLPLLLAPAVMAGKTGGAAAAAGSPLLGALAVGSAATKVVGGIAGHRQAGFEADIARQNQAAALEASDAEGDRLRREHQVQLSRQVANLASRGVQLTGSPLDLIASQTAIAQENELLARFKGKVQARNFGEQAKAAKSRGRASLLSSLGGAGGTLLGNAKDVKAFAKNPGGAFTV